MISQQCLERMTRHLADAMVGMFVPPLPYTLDVSPFAAGPKCFAISVEINTGPGVAKIQNARRR